MKSGGNGHGRLLRPGEGISQGQVLGQGGMGPKELELRQKMEFNLVMASNLQQAIAVAGDMVKKYNKENPNYMDAPEGERHRAEALDVHEDFVEMQLRMLRTIRGQMKKCSPFSGMKDLKFKDVADIKEA